MAATQGTPPPLLDVPTAKEKKYDRQLRLWAASGQAALEDSHVLLVNSGCGVVGIEALKNLILPGIGQFTIVDPAVVIAADLGVNFFLKESDLGASRAQSCCDSLTELNPDVKGNSIPESIEKCMEDDHFFDAFTLILVSAPLPASTLRKIANHAHINSTPILYLHSLGFYSHFSISLSTTFPIVDTHPEPTSISDLRVLEPWPELHSLMRGQTEHLERLNDHDHGHVPYVLLLIYYVDKWREQNGGKLPTEYRQKQELKRQIHSENRQSSAEGPEENFQEAEGAVMKSVNPFSIPSSVRDVFDADETRNLTKESTSFWVIASAVSHFVIQHKNFPLPGSLPDMKAQSADYIALQQVYKLKANKDLAEVVSAVRSTEARLGRSLQIDEKEIEAFCKNASSVKVVRGRPLQAIPDNDTMYSFGDRAKSIRQELDNPESLVLQYVAFLAYDALYTERVSSSSQEDLTQLPGALTGNIESDTRRLIERTERICSDLAAECGNAISFEAEDPSAEESTLSGRIEKVAREMIRAGGSELHNISSLTGGIVAQEIIKIITRQYVPVDNTCLFNGILSAAQVYKF